MKRYLGFAGPKYYPEGGWGDFRGDFDTLDEAIRSCEAEGPDNATGLWAHVVDTHEVRVIMVGDWQNTGPKWDEGSWTWETADKGEWPAGGRHCDYPE